MQKTIHFEGIPGSGKSTAAQRFCEILQSRGIDAAWWLEESVDHPIMPKEKRALSNNKHFSDVCLNAWRSFLESQANSVGILDGYAFQSTVRFLFEQQASRDLINNYFSRWQEFAPDTSITYLFVNDPVEHYKIVLPERGQDWTKKLFAWTEQTPLGIASNLQGESGFVEFWSIYQDLCFELLSSAFIQVQLIEARSWHDVDLQNLATSRGLFSLDRPDTQIAKN